MIKQYACNNGWSVTYNPESLSMGGLNGPGHTFYSPVGDISIGIYPAGEEQHTFGIMSSPTVEVTLPMQGIKNYGRAYKGMDHYLSYYNGDLGSMASAASVRSIYKDGHATITIKDPEDDWSRVGNGYLRNLMSGVESSDLVLVFGEQQSPAHCSKPGSGRYGNGCSYGQSPNKVIDLGPILDGYLECKNSPDLKIFTSEVDAEYDAYLVDLVNEHEKSQAAEGLGLVLLGFMCLALIFCALSKCHSWWREDKQRSEGIKNEIKDWLAFLLFFGIFAFLIDTEVYGKSLLAWLILGVLGLFGAAYFVGVLRERRKNRRT